MRLYIKNMVCNRCIMVVRQQLENAGFRPTELKLGEVELNEVLTAVQIQKLNNELMELGFEILGDQKQKEIDSIKTLLIEKIQSGDIEEHFVSSDFLRKNKNKDYTQLSRLFSEVEGVTLEQFFILQKIEKV